MKSQIIYLSFLFVLSPFICISQKFTFVETKTNQTIKNYKKVLLAGIGSVETRLFLETLSEKLIKEFESRKVESNFFYLGDDPKEANEQVKTLLNNQYDAIIIFAPLDSAFFSVLNYKSGTQSYTPGIGTIITSRTSRKIIYAQDLYVNLIEIVPQKSLIWSVNLSLDFDPTKRRIYSQITKSFTKSLRNNKILN